MSGIGVRLSYRVTNYDYALIINLTNFYGHLDAEYVRNEIVFNVELYLAF